MEDLPDPKIIKGVLSRAFVLECVAGSPKYNIKDILKYAGDSKYKPTYDELLDVRKLLFAYRMQHFPEVIPDVSLNIRNRDEELAKPYIRLFQNSPNILKEVQSALSYFLNEKNKLKKNSIEAKLLKVVLNLIQNKKSNLPPDRDIYFIENEEIWAEAKNEMNGIEIPNKPHSSYSVEYGIISHSSISRRLKTKFKGKPTQSGSGYDNRRGFNFSKKILDRISLAYESNDSIEIISTQDDISGNNNNNNDAEAQDIRVTKVTEVTDSIDRQGIIKDNFDVNNPKPIISKEDEDNDITSNSISNNSSSDINDHNDNSNSSQTITRSENIENNPHLPIGSVTSVTSVTESGPSSTMHTKNKENMDNNNTTLLSGLPKIPCIFCNYSNPIRFDLEIHLIEKHRMDLVKLRIGKTSMDVRVDYAIDLGASGFSRDKEESDGKICDKEDEEEKDVNDDY